MWDDHWCKSAARRVTEMAGPFNDMVKAARARGLFVIHAPSSVTKFYQDTPQRKRAQTAPFTKTPVPLATAQRWGTAWCWTDPKPAKRCCRSTTRTWAATCTPARNAKSAAPWKRQIATLEITAEPDAITDNGQETWNLLGANGASRNVILCGCSFEHVRAGPALRHPAAWCSVGQERGPDARPDRHDVQSRSKPARTWIISPAPTS